MSHTNPLALRLVQGKRFQKIWRWGSDVKVYKPISAMPQATPVRFTVTAHGMPDGWPCRVTGVQGPSAFNDRWFKAKVVDVNTIEFNAANAAGLAAFVASAGAFIEYFAPMDLAGISGGIAVFKELATDTSAALEISQANSRMILDNTAKTILFDVPGSALAAMTKYGGVWDWEMTSGGQVLDPRGELLQLPPWTMVREAAT
jgi:hypothetical protein